MSALTSKSSSQHFFLRILKVIIQLRDAARTANKKKRIGQGIYYSVIKMHVCCAVKSFGHLIELTGSTDSSQMTSSVFSGHL